MKISYIKQRMCYRMQYASYYAVNKKDMVRRFRNSYFKIRFLSNTDNNKVAASCVTYFDKLSKKEKQRIIDCCWNGNFSTNKEKLFYTRKLAKLNEERLRGKERCQ